MLFVFSMILIPLISFGMLIFVNALNVPYNDDEALLYSLNQFCASPSDSLPALFEQQNDHRIFFSRFASVIVKLVHGKMNFRLMIICGYLNLVLLGYAFFSICKSENTGLIYFIPVPILLFSPIVYATHLWAITSFEYTLAITFSLFCLLFLQPSKQKIWFWSIPFAMAAAVSNLDGLSVFPVGLVWLICQKRTRESIYFGIFAILYLTLFFKGFHFSEASKFPPFPQIFGIVFKAFISYCGSILKVLSDTHGVILSIMAGSLILTIFFMINSVKFFRTKDWGNGLFPVGISEIGFLELLACGMMIALGRAGDVPGSMLAIRFQIYAVSTFVLFYLVVIGALKDRRYKKYFFISFVSGTLALNGLSWIKYENAIAIHNDQLMVDSYNFSNHSFFLYQYTENQDPASTLYNHYEFPEYFAAKEIRGWCEKINAHFPNPNVKLTAGNLNHLPEYQRWIYPVISFEIKNLPQSVPKKGVYLMLYNRENPMKLFLVAVRHHHVNWLDKVKQNHLAGRSLSVIFPKKMSGHLYDVSLCWKARGADESVLIARSLNLDEVAKTPLP